MRKSVCFILIAFSLIIAQAVSAQTTKTVGGSGSNYATLKLAFDAVNAGTVSGTIIFRLTGNTTETSSAVLNASGVGSANYTSVTIYPAVSGLTISGSITAPLIDLNGADNVIIDGRVNQAGTTTNLVISNTDKQTSSSTVRFLSSAENNTVKYCVIKGSETSTSKGILFFSTAASGNGNDGNTISNNNITSTSAGRPVNGIYSSGTASHENSGNTISDNNFYDIWRNTSASCDIQLGANSTAWVISGNSFYETSTVTPSGAYTYYAIKISNTSGIDFRISGNYIGGKLAQCGGAALTSNGSALHLFQGIYLNIGTTTASSVQNNVIKNFNYTSKATNPWQGINIVAGSVYIGTVTGNVFGSAAGTDGVRVTCGGGTAIIYAINMSGSGVITCQKNIISGITTNHSASGAASLYAINRNATGTATISNNIIGSVSQSNSLNASAISATNAQSVYGIYNSGSGTLTVSNNTIANLTNGTTCIAPGTNGQLCGIISIAGTNTISDNIIHDLNSANANNGTDNSSAVVGINASGSTLKSITGNVIYNLTNSFVAFTGTIAGLYFEGNSGSNMISGNFIHDLNITGNNATGSKVYGIIITSGSATFSNNLIVLGGSTLTTIYGIYDKGTSAQTCNLYFNTVYIGGSISSGNTAKSYALYNKDKGSTRNYRNNIFANCRSTTAGSNLHYAAYFNFSSSTNLVLDNNDYYAPGTGGVLGSYSGSNKISLPIITGQDGSSAVINPGFAVAGGSVPVDYIISATLNGSSGTGITTDFNGITRGSPPKMGALESNNYIWQGNTSSDFATASNWVGAVVPASGANIVFASNPGNSCVLDQNRIVGSVTNAQSIDKLDLNGKQLTVYGNLNFTNNAQIIASATSSIIKFAGTSVQSITSGVFANNIVDGIDISNNSGLTLIGDITLTSSLILTNGTFLIGANTLTLNGALTVLSGTLSGSSLSNMSIGGSGTNLVLPAITLKNLTLNRANGMSLGGALNLSGNLALTSGTMIIGANVFTFSGNTITHTNGTIDASDGSATVDFANSSALTFPAVLFAGSINNLTISGAGGITAGSDLSINGVLNLAATNPSATKGLLEMTKSYGTYPGTTNSAYLDSYILIMGASAITSGIGDVTGTVKRTSILENTVYTFGNEYTTISLTSGDMPSVLSVTITIGQTLAAIPDAVQRTYEIVPVMPAGSVSTAHVNANFHYLDSELASNAGSNYLNTESNMVTWDYDIGGGILPDEHGRANYDFTNNFIGMTNIPIDYFIILPSHNWRTVFTLRDFLTDHYTWNGSISEDWGDAVNWTPVGTPADVSHVIIPDAATTNNDPVLGDKVVLNTMTIENGGVLIMNDKIITIKTSLSGGWEDQNPTGNDPGTSKVIFQNPGTSISGFARFYDVEIADSAEIYNQAGNIMKIQNAITKTGTGKWFSDVYDATIEYDGGEQTVIVPDGNPNYHNLILSGSGNKSMPAAVLSIHGNLIVSGTATAAAGAPIVTSGNFTIDAGTSFNTGAFNDTIGGNFENNGTFIAAPGNTIIMNGLSNQSIGGSSDITLEKLVISNNFGVVLFRDIIVKNTLHFENGKLELSSGNLTIDKQATITGFDQLKYIIAGSNMYDISNGRLIRFIKNTTLAADEVFPLGTATSYTPCYIENSNSAGTNYKVNLFEKVMENGTLGFEIASGVTMCTWDIIPENEAYADATTLTLQWDYSVESPNFNKAEAAIYKNRHIAGVDDSWAMVPGALVRQISTSPFTLSVDGISTFSNFTGSTGSVISGALPIELVSLDATCLSKDKAEISWSTATETNNNFFTIETSSDASSWEIAGIVKGADNSNQLRHYSFVYSAGINEILYYRLKQTDYDGKFTYSKVKKMLPCESTGSTFKVFPNPFSKEVSIFYNSETNQNIEVVVEDMKGITVYSTNFQMQKGSNINQIDLSDLAPGNYLVRLSGTNSEPYKIVKQ